MFNERLLAKLHSTGVLAVLVIDNAADAVPVANALMAGGVDCIELTLRTPAAMESLRLILEEVPRMTTGVGSILTIEQVKAVTAAGAAFGVAPGMNPRVVLEAKCAGLSFAPGVCTPSEIEQALECDCRLLKFFPAEPQGGLTYLKSIAAPFAHLNVRFIPLGGIDASNAARYLADPSIQTLGGSWIAPRDLIQKQDWPAITQRALQVSEIVKRIRSAK